MRNSLSVPLYLCLSVSHLRFHSLITVSGPKGVFPLGWQQQRDRERETGRASSGEAWQTPLVIFPPSPIDSVSSGLVLAGPPSSEGLDNMPSTCSYQTIRENFITGKLSRQKQEEVWRLSSLHCHFFPFQHIPFLLTLFHVSLVLPFFPTFPSFFYWCRLWTKSS